MNRVTTSTVDDHQNRRPDRAAARLGNSDAATIWLLSLGLDQAAARRIGIGLEHEDEHGLVIVHPCYDRQGASRILRHRVDRTGRMGSTTAGYSAGVWSTAPAPGDHVLVVPSISDMWRLQAALSGDLAPFVAVAPSHGCGLPIEWSEASHWLDFAGVTMLLDDVFTQGALLSTVASAAASISDVATPPASERWKEAVGTGSFRSDDLIYAVRDALPVNLFLHSAADAERREAVAIDVNGHDQLGRAMRVIRVEERVNGAAGERIRFRDIVVRSDGMLLAVSIAPSPPGTPMRDRLITLSDGTRLVRMPTSACDWSLPSVSHFVSEHAEAVKELGTAALLETVANAISNGSGLEGEAVDVAAAFVMLSHVYGLFDHFRVPVFYGANPVTRARLIGVISRLSHGGSVHSRTRSDVLATTSGEVGGAILLDEPGPLAGPAGATEIGRFILASSFADAVWERTSGSGPKTRSVFGPRAVFSQRAPSATLGGVEFSVELASSGRTGSRNDPTVCDLVDRLYLWSMRVHRAGGLAVLEADQLIASAFRRLTTQEHCGDDGSVVKISAPVDGESMMVEALEACVEAGGSMISMTQLMMEIATRGGDPEEFTPERVGRWLCASGALAPGSPSTRRRLHGHVSRLYEMDRPLDETTKPMDPFAFCISSRCPDCRYIAVCEDVAPGMMACKTRRPEKN